MSGFLVTTIVYSITFSREDEASLWAFVSINSVLASGALGVDLVRMVSWTGVCVLRTSECVTNFVSLQSSWICGWTTFTTSYSLITTSSLGLPSPTSCEVLRVSLERTYLGCFELNTNLGTSSPCISFLRIMTTEDARLVLPNLFYIAASY